MSEKPFKRVYLYLLQKVNDGNYYLECSCDQDGKKDYQVIFVRLLFASYNQPAKEYYPIDKLKDMSSLLEKIEAIMLNVPRGTLGEE